MLIKPAVRPRSTGCLGQQIGGQFSGHRQSVHESVSRSAELDESALPNRAPFIVDGVVACRALAFRSKPHAHGLRHFDSRAVKDSRQPPADVHLVPPSVAPRAFILISPVTIATRVQSGEFGQERARTGVPISRLLRVEIVDAIAIHRVRVKRVSLGNQRLALGQGDSGRLRKFVKRPQAERRFIASQRCDRRCGNSPHTARDAHIVHQSGTADSVLDRASDSEFARHDRFHARRKRLLFHQLSVHEKSHAFLLQNHREVMPRIIANRDAASHFASLSRQIHREVTGSRV